MHTCKPTHTYNCSMYMQNICGKGLQFYANLAQNSLKVSKKYMHSHAQTYQILFACLLLLVAYL